MQFINSVPDHQQYLNDLILEFAAHCYTYKIIMMSTVIELMLETMYREVAPGSRTL